VVQLLIIRLALKLTVYDVRKTLLDNINLLPDTEVGSSGSDFATLFCLSSEIILLTAARGSVLGKSASRLANTASTIEMMIHPEDAYRKVSVTLRRRTTASAKDAVWQHADFLLQSLSKTK
jgi:hypothetical protein